MRSNSSNKESVLAITLLLLLLFLYSRNLNFIYASSLFIIICLLYTPAADLSDWIWKKITHILGLISSSIILTVLFFLIVLPMGLVLKLANKSPLLLNVGEKRSTFILRNKLFTNKDLQNPY
jgi:hypothetical protein